MRRVVVLGYGLVAYALFGAVFLYEIAFLANLAPKAIDTGAAPVSAGAVTVDVLLLALFGVQHSVMARASFKRWWTRWVPKAAERSTYVLFASLLFGLAMWQWRAIDGEVWRVDQPVIATLLWALFAGGFALQLVGSMAIDHFHLLGLRQVWAYFRECPFTPPPFQVQNVNRFVRHPIILGLLVSLWCVPVMTRGRLLFSCVFTLYSLIGTFFEERDLERYFPDRYRRYREQVPALFPSLRGPAPVQHPKAPAIDDR